MSDLTTRLRALAEEQNRLAVGASFEHRARCATDIGDAIAQIARAADLERQLAALTEERTTLVNDLIDYENVRQHLAATNECQKRHDTLDRVENERDALRADLDRVTAERDDLAKRAFNLADEVEQAQDCGNSQDSDCCGECVACRDVTFADTVSQLAAARQDAEALRAQVAALASRAVHAAKCESNDGGPCGCWLAEVLSAPPAPAPAPDLAEPLAPPGTDRWEAGIDHEPASIALYKSIAAIDEEMFDDSFCFKAGGDGDNGETLMYLLDEHFARAHNRQRLAGVR